MIIENYTKYSNGIMGFGHYASQSNISAYTRSILIRRSLHSQFLRVVPAALFQRRAVTAVWPA